MFGGQLIPHSYSPISAQQSDCSDALLVGFGTCFYLFEQNTERILTQLDLGHQCQIVGSLWDAQLCVLVTVDQCGDIRVNSIKGNHCEIADSVALSLSQNTKPKNKSPNSQTLIKTAKIFKNSSDCSLLIFYIKHSDLYRCQLSTNKTISVISNNRITYGKQLQTLSTQYDEHLLAIADRKLSVFSDIFVEVKSHQYTHQCQITSAVISQQTMTVVIGDCKGKIYILHNELSHSKEKKSTTKLEWHVNEVSTLFLHEKYLYSAGEQGVIVMWHLSDLSRDFLPRIGSSIRQIAVVADTNLIICYLNNNTVKTIDIAHEKQTHTYRLIHNSNGYPTNSTFSKSNQSQLIRYNPETNKICLYSVSGRLQFLNLNNGQCLELQIQNRNLVSGLDSQYPQPHQIASYAFSDQQWSTLLVAMKGVHNHCCLKFYRKQRSQDNGYELLCKIENPHVGYVSACLCLTTNKFLTYSQSDSVIRIWSQRKQAKKSIINTDVIVWRCETEFCYRELIPMCVNALKGIVMIVYRSELLILDEKDLVSGQCRSFKINNLIEQIHILSKNCLAIVYRDMTMQICQHCAQSNQLSTLAKIDGKTVSNITVYPNQTNTETAVIVSLVDQPSQCQILLFDTRTSQFTQSYKCNTSACKLISAFWAHNNLILLTDDLTLQSLTQQQFVSYGYEAKVGPSEMWDELTQIKQSPVYQSDIYALNEKWAAREDAKKREMSQQWLSSQPDCSTALKSLLARVIL